MIAERTALDGVVMFRTTVHQDARGAFREVWRGDSYAAAGAGGTFVQDNVSVSHRGVLRGLHYQVPAGQGKLVSVVQGEAFDVAVDIRLGSPTFGQWVGVHLCGESGTQLYIPPGFAHGFQALQDNVVLSYKCTEYYDPDGDRSIHWADPDIGIEWPISDPTVSPKDASAGGLADAAQLPSFAHSTG